MWVDYNKYIVSKEWKDKSKQWIIETGECQRCKSGYRLTCHHINYKNLGHERRKDIKVLCWDCHKKYHINCEGKRISIKEFEKRLQKIRDRKLGFIKNEEPNLDSELILTKKEKKSIKKKLYKEKLLEQQKLKRILKGKGLKKKNEK